MTSGGSSDILAGRSLYLCTPDRPDLEQFVRACIAGGVDIVQLREKNLDARPLLDRARMLRSVCGELSVPFILNDRPDLALAVEADGVHVGQDDVPPSVVRQILGPDCIVGLSTHQISEFSDAIVEPVDYVSVGPVVPTPTKPGRVGTGLDYVRFASRTAANAPRRGNPIPFYVTGGVSPESVEALAEAGARRFVVVRYLTESINPREAARRLKDAIATAVEPS